MTCTGAHREFEGAPSSLRIFLAKGREEKEQKEDGCLSSALLTGFFRIFKIHYYFLKLPTWSDPQKTLKIRPKLSFLL
jgi:hypothetical protein